MKKNEQFREIQFSKPWWYWLLLLATNGLMLFACFQQVVLGKQFGTNPASDGWLIGITIFTALVTAGVLIAKLDTFIDKSGVYVRFLPFQQKYKFFDWNSVASYEVRKYNPSLEYGGWGYRFRSGKKIAYSMRGRIGLELTFIDGKKVMIGTQKQDEMLDFLKRLKEDGSN